MRLTVDSTRVTTNSFSIKAFMAKAWTMLTLEPESNLISHGSKTKGLRLTVLLCIRHLAFKNFSNLESGKWIGNWRGNSNWQSGGVKWRSQDGKAVEGGQTPTVSFAIEGVGSWHQVFEKSKDIFNLGEEISDEKDLALALGTKVTIKGKISLYWMRMKQLGGRA